MNDLVGKSDTNAVPAAVGRCQRKRQVRSELTRRAIEDAAEELFIKQGFGGTTVDQIASQAGVTKGGLYFSFKDKESLLVRLLERADLLILDPMLGNIEKHLDNPLKALDEYVDWWAKVAVTEWRKLLLPILMSVEFMSSGSKAAVHLRARYGKLYGLVLSIIESGQVRGVLRTEAKPKELAMVLVAITDGMLLEWLRHGTQIDGRGVVQALRRTLFSGMIANH